MFYTSLLSIPRCLGKWSMTEISLIITGVFISVISKTKLEEMLQIKRSQKLPLKTTEKITSVLSNCVVSIVSFKRTIS